MKIAIIILFVLVCLAIIIGLVTMMFVILRLEEYDKFREVQDRKIENIRQGGEQLTKRMNALEKKR